MERKATTFKLLELSSLVSHGANITAATAMRRGWRERARSRRFGDEITRINNPEVRGAQ